MADASRMRIAVVRSIFNASVTAGLLEGALAALREAGAEEIRVVDVPGAFELPLTAQALAGSGYDAVVALGAVILGETDHYEHIARQTSQGLMRVMLDTGVPVTFGVLTVRDEAHALVRSTPGPENKGREAAEAAIGMAGVLRSLNEVHTPGSQ